MVKAPTMWFESGSKERERQKGREIHLTKQEGRLIEKMTCPKCNDMDKRDAFEDGNLLLFVSPWTLALSNSVPCNTYQAIRILAIELAGHQAVMEPKGTSLHALQTN